MYNQEKYNEDILRQYIEPESIEKAPGGFTSKVMSHILLEKQPSIISDRIRRKNPVLVISGVVTILLIIAAFLIPGNESDAISLPVLKLIGNIKASLPEIKSSPIFHLAIPSVLIYVIIGVSVLTLFDRALYGIFHREK
jgi:hypothetical protein